MPTAATDAELIAAALADDAAAFETLVLRHQQELRIFIAARANGAELVEEVLQTTFVAAWELLGGYRGEGSFQGWLKGIARNRLQREYRARAQAGSVLVDELDRLLDHELERRLEAQAEQREDELQRLRRCLERLPERGRNMLLRHHGEGLPLARLAQQFRQTRAVIAKTLFRLRRNLRDCVQGAAS